MNFAHLLRSSLASSLLMTTAASAAASQFSIIYRSKSPTVALQPPLTAARPGGALYATTSGGGAFGMGSVVSLTAPPPSGGSWLQTTIYSFTGGKDGSGPNAGLVLAKDGSLFGTAFFGGTVFHLIPPAQPGGAWTEETIYAFDQPGGPLPTGHLISDASGNLYGTAESNPNLPNPLGIYRLAPPAQTGGAWTFNRVYNYTSSQSEQGGLTATPSGAIISTLLNKVIALKVSTDGQNTAVQTIFDLGSAGYSTDASALVLPSGIILLPTSGATQYGQVVALHPPAGSGAGWTLSVAYAFTYPDGAYPEGRLEAGRNGAVFGTTYGGGATGDGTVYQLTPPATPNGTWSERVLHSFLGKLEGQTPDTGVVLSGTSLFGLAATNGNNLNDIGFEITAGQ